MNEIKNTLIVLNYIDYETTINYLTKIKDYKDIDGIIVVDNNSPNDSYNKLKLYENEKITVIKTNKNGGYSFGNNYGIKYAEKAFCPKYYIISNPDVIFKEGFIKECCGYMDKNQDTAAVTGRMKNLSGDYDLGVGWKLPKYKDVIISSLLFANKFFNKTYYSKKDFGQKVMNTDVIHGSLLVLRADSMKSAGYYDEDTFLYCEENILAFKLKSIGYKSIILNNVEFYHMHSQSIDKSIVNLVKKYKILQKSRRLYIKKYLSAGSLKLVFFDFITKFGMIEYLIYSDFKKIKKR